MNEHSYRMVYYRKDVTMASSSGREDAVLTASEIAQLCDCHPDLIEKLWRFGVIDEISPEGASPRFAASAVSRIRKAQRLRHDLGVGYDAMGLILDLLDRIESLEEELSNLRSRL